MGHGASKQEPGMEIRPGMELIYLTIEKVKRRVRVRKWSIVSTAELLRPEERDGMVDDDDSRGAVAMAKKEEEEEDAGSPETIADADAEEEVKEEKRIDEEDKVATEAAAEDEEKKAELGYVGADDDEEDDKKGRQLGYLTADANRPESPSFRFYCTDLGRESEDDGSFKFGGGNRKHQLPEMEEKKVADKSYDDSKDLEAKPLKKDKQRKLKALTKASSRTYSLLNVRNCYGNRSSAIG